MRILLKSVVVFLALDNQLKNSQHSFFTKYFYGNHIKENEKRGTYRTLGDVKKVNTTSVRKRKEKRPLGKPRRRSLDNRTLRFRV